MAKRFDIPDNVFEELCEAHAETHAIPTSDGVKPLYTEAEWFEKYYMQQWIEEINNRRDRKVVKQYQKITEEDFKTKECL